MHTSGLISKGRRHILQFTRETYSIKIIMNVSVWKHRLFAKFKKRISLELMGATYSDDKKELIRNSCQKRAEHPLNMSCFLSNIEFES